MQRVNELTGGASLRANIQLVKQNAAVGAQVMRPASEQYYLRHFSRVCRLFLAGCDRPRGIVSSGGCWSQAFRV